MNVKEYITDVEHVNYLVLERVFGKVISVQTHKLLLACPPIVSLKINDGFFTDAESDTLKKTIKIFESVACAEILRKYHSFTEEELELLEDKLAWELRD